MHLASFVFICLSFYYASADSAQPDAAIAGTHPETVSMNCSKSYLPLSPWEIAQMRSKGNLDKNQLAKLSRDPVEVVCQNGSAENNGAMCDFKTCSGGPAVCDTCYPVAIKDGKLVKTSENSVNKVECGKNYFLNSKKDHNVCTTEKNIMYSCTGECKGSIECQSCVNLDDPAYKNTH
ncbi:hypothetical protein PCANC_00956 [Puccinia coronata f. sp. avenae]|uniref:Secreted protein n=1 Tax=Puccinia coronata f. sp. avenae TaxID=200324 RepID=A0A2N5T7Z1_9BASI|nr:hypothetical protein PCANC_03979 [Puccinia coronata f. sp. avenae]PLW49831.1 hypothetical protein PCASD_01556 [Puccinia coronata f. sp. avenae]PLW57883.1 hypothetical protein PCANC_00956 [Puccinia coronata f. sp. avenae]